MVHAAKIKNTQSRVSIDVSVPKAATIRRLPNRTPPD